MYDPPGTSDPNTIVLAGTASDDGEIVEVTWSNNRGGSGTASGTTDWTISDIDLFCGDDNIITVTAEDAEGNLGTDTLIIDVEPCPVPDININILPNIYIEVPTSEGNYNSVENKINLAGTASDADGEIVMVTWSNNRGDSGEAEGTTDWNASNIKLFCGADNIITVTAEDDQGGTATAVLTVDVPPVFPEGIRIIPSSSE